MFTFYTNGSEKLARALTDIGGERVDIDKTPDIFLSIYANCNVNCGILISNMVCRKVVCFLHDKFLVASLGVSPQTWLPNDASIRFPVIVKPRKGANGGSTYPVAHNRKDLDALNLQGKIVQSFMGDIRWAGDEKRIFVLFGASGNVVASDVVCTRPPSDGSGNWKWDSMPLDTSLIARLELISMHVQTLWQGTAQYQWASLDVFHHNNEWYILDINPASAAGLFRFIPHHAHTWDFECDTCMWKNLLQKINVIS